MRFVSVIFAITLLLVGKQFGFAQGFANLDFEDATITLDTSSAYYPYAAYASDAIPGWTATGCFLGTNDITYNTISLGATDISILGINGTPSALDGNFSVSLQGGLTASAASISQTGLVPVGTKSLLFEAQRYGFDAGGILLVLLGGQNIPFFALSTGPNYTLYGGDISAFAGQTEELTFSALNQPGIYPNNWNIDDIQFSTSPIPEPNELALAALGTLLLGLRRWRNSSR